MFHFQVAQTYHVSLPVCANLHILHMEKLISYIINSPFILSQNYLMSLSFEQTKNCCLQIFLILRQYNSKHCVSQNCLRRRESACLPLLETLKLAIANEQMVH